MLKRNFKKKVCFFSLAFMVSVAFIPHTKDVITTIYGTFGTIVIACLAGHTISDIKEPRN